VLKYAFFICQIKNSNIPLLWDAQKTHALEEKYVSANPEIGIKKLDSSGAIVTLFWSTGF
jgi:hypothetical protein